MMAILWSGGHNPAKMSSPARMATMAFKATVGSLLAIAALHLALRDAEWSRSLLLTSLAFTFLSLVTVRVAFLRLQPALRNRRPQQGVAIIGVGGRAQGLSERLREYGHQAFAMKGFITPAMGSEIFQVDPTKVLGPVMSLPALVAEQNIEVLILASERLNRDEHMMLASQADALGVNLLEMPTSWGMANPRTSLASLGDLQLVDLTTLAYPTQAERLKRLLDLALVCSGGLILLPVLGLLGAAIRLTDGGPALYTQKRSGLGGRPFDMYKFRSMVVDADQLRASLSDQNQAEGVLFKIEDDPRVTSIGRWLRRWSLDEFPQLLNVLKGEMNLVGPRPLPMEDLGAIEDDAELRYWFTQRSKVRPGITGTWQVKNRASLKMKDMVRLDIDYIQNWSVFVDLVLLVKTIPAVLSRRGAR